MKAFLTFLLIPVILMPLFAGEPLVMGEKVKFYSKVLKEDRTIWVYCPEDYAYSTAKYPVFYLLDGDIHFHYLTGFIDFFSSRQYIPQMIVVAIPNTDRVRDLTPVHFKNRPNSGGSGKFLQFLKEELFPYVETKYRTQPYRILAGHSLAGMFTVHTLFTTQELFNAYIAASPSLHWGDRVVFKEAETFFKEQTALTKKFFFYTVGGKEWERTITNARELEKQLKEKAPKGLEWHFRFLEKDDHDTISHRTLYNGLETLYTGFIFPFEESSAQSMEGIKSHYRRMSEKYGYSVSIPIGTVNLVGYDFLMQGKPDEAIKMFTFSAKNHPDMPNVYNLLGLAYERKEELEAAKKYFKKACGLAEKYNHPGLKNFKKHLERVKKELTFIFERKK